MVCESYVVYVCRISEQLNKAKTQLDQTGRTSTSAVGELHQRYEKTNSPFEEIENESCTCEIYVWSSCYRSVENEQLREDLREREEEVAIYRKVKKQLFPQEVFLSNRHLKGL